MPTTEKARRTQAFASLRTRMFTLCLILLILSVLFLFWDLGSPQRVLLVLLRPHATVLTFGSFCLLAEILLGLLLVLSTLFRIRQLQGRAETILEVLCCLVSLATMAYTGVFLATNAAAPFWNSWTLVALFLFSSLSCGMALMLLVDWFIKDQTLLLRAARPLQKWHLAFLAGEAVSLCLLLGHAFSDPAAEAALSLLASPDLLPTAIVGVLGFGLALPALCESYSLAQQECRTIPVSDVLCLTGGLILRFCVIACGVH